MARDIDACFFFGKEEVRRDAGLRREAVLVLADIQAYYKFRHGLHGTSRSFIFSVKTGAIRA
ncbi:hypothetical protein [uncultured Bacteroides sp.]|uniref:hypothetical protein n=1 Tax=uncultured Bacteroides sp. TaxID=162156 RepID=UPI0025E08F3D|nr:hypothetical protein [uncultured Bacteroides sp.]